MNNGISMKMQKSAFPLSLMLLILMSVLPQGWAQDEPQRVFMYLNYFERNNDKTLVAELKYRDEDRVFHQLPNVEVAFYAMTEDEDVELGAVTTGEDGKAILALTTAQFLADTSGVAVFEARFKGNDGYRRASRDVEVKDLDLMVTTEVVDSVNTVTVEALELKNGNKIPVEEADVQLLVKRLYSDLPIIEMEIEDGTAEAEFPSDLPGDHYGDLIVIARIADHDDYGTVETRSSVRWGVPVSFELEEKPRALWSRAPYWLMFAIGAALLAAWYHYFLALYKLLKIRKI